MRLERYQTRLSGKHGPRRVRRELPGGYRYHTRPSYFGRAAHLSIRSSYCNASGVVLVPWNHRHLCDKGARVRTNVERSASQDCQRGHVSAG